MRNTFDDSTLLTLKMKEWATSQEMQKIYRSLQSKEIDFPLEHPESQPC